MTQYLKALPIVERVLKLQSVLTTYEKHVAITKAIAFALGAVNFKSSIAIIATTT